MEPYAFRLLQPDDASCFFDLARRCREQFREYFPKTLAGTETLGSTEAYVKEIVQKIDAGELYHFILRDRQTIAGFYFIKSIDYDIRKAEIGYFTDPQYQGRGLATRAVQKLLHYCWEELFLNKVYLRIEPVNTASIRVAEKCGFIREGLLRQDFRKPSGIYADILYYGLLKQDYRK